MAKIAIIGDVMLDVYISGAVDRISPEAPVPIVNVEHRKFELGGAANVARNIKTLGHDPFLIGAIGDDEEGDKLASACELSGIANHLLKRHDRPTTCKTRIVAKDYQIVRLDSESTEQMNGHEEAVLDVLEGVRPDAVIFSDYDKGFISTELIQGIGHKRQYWKIADPKYRHFEDYWGFHVLKPNLIEFQYALPNFNNSLFDMIHKLRLDALIVTEGKEGAFLQTSEYSTYTNIESERVEVADSTGAGDTFTAAVTVGLVNGLSYKEAARFANKAASISVVHHGCYAVSSEDLCGWANSV